MKRTVQNNSSERFLKELGEKKRASKNKTIPRGFRFIISDNGTLMIKNLKTGVETPVA